MTIRYRARYTCQGCNHHWSGNAVVAHNGLTPEQDALYQVEMNGTPPCPNCGLDQKTRGIDLTLNKAPATVGQSLGVKAIDETARIVMQDYGLTDLRSDVRQGETTAPKIAPALQAQADSFFGAPGKRRTMAARDPHTGRVVPLRTNPNLIGRAAIAGAYRQSDAATVGGLSEAIRPPVKVVAGDPPGRR